jgi:hypothetical protein
VVFDRTNLGSGMIFRVLLDAGHAVMIVLRARLAVCAISSAQQLRCPAFALSESDVVPFMQIHYLHSNQVVIRVGLITKQWLQK